MIIDCELDLWRCVVVSFDVDDAPNGLPRRGPHNNWQDRRLPRPG